MVRSIDPSQWMFLVSHLELRQPQYEEVLVLDPNCQWQFGVGGICENLSLRFPKWMTSCLDLFFFFFFLKKSYRCCFISLGSSWSQLWLHLKSLFEYYLDFLSRCFKISSSLKTEDVISSKYLDIFLWVFISIYRPSL